jgi:hypothetical protein
MLEETKARAVTKSAWRQLGKIRMGVKVATGRKQDCDHPQDELCYRCSRPKDLDYFVIPDAIKGALGPEPKEISIVLMNRTLEECFNTAATWYGATGINCRTDDSITARRYMRTALEGGGFEQTTPERGKKETFDKYEWKEIPCPGTKCEYREQKKCQARGYLKFGIPALGKEFFGEWTMESGSAESAARIYKTLKNLEEVCRDRGRKDGIAWMRLLLRRVPKERTIDQKHNGKRAKVTRYIAIVDVDWNALLNEDQALLLPLLGETHTLATLMPPEKVEAVVMTEAEVEGETAGEAEG